MILCGNMTDSLSKNIPCCIQNDDMCCVQTFSLGTLCCLSGSATKFSLSVMHCAERCCSQEEYLFFSCVLEPLCCKNVGKESIPVSSALGAGVFCFLWKIF